MEKLQRSEKNELAQVQYFEREMADRHTLFSITLAIIASDVKIHDCTGCLFLDCKQTSRHFYYCFVKQEFIRSEELVG